MRSTQVRVARLGLGFGKARDQGGMARTPASQYKFLQAAERLSSSMRAAM